MIIINKFGGSVQVGLGVNIRKHTEGLIQLHLKNFKIFYRKDIVFIAIHKSSSLVLKLHAWPFKEINVSNISANPIIYCRYQNWIDLHCLLSFLTSENESTLWCSEQLITVMLITHFEEWDGKTVVWCLSKIKKSWRSTVQLWKLFCRHV